MTTLSIYRIPNINVINFIYTQASKITSQISKVREYNRTVSELKKLSPRILEDIGIAQSNINSVAYDHIYGKKVRWS